MNFTTRTIKKAHNAVRLDSTLRRALHDASQTTDPALQREALDWLWICCPDIAEQMALAKPHQVRTTAMAAD